MTTDGKSSNEILTELFSAFNAEPPALSLEPVVHSPKKSHKHSKKSKKSKKKHKHKKRKKKSLNEAQDDANVATPPKKKRKSAPKVQVPVEEVNNTLDILFEHVEKDTQVAESSQSENHLNCQSSNVVETEPVQDVSNKTETVKSNDQVVDPKRARIIIPNLKNSTVFQETLRAVEEREKQKKEKRARYEEGELSDSSSSSFKEQDSDEKLDVANSDEKRSSGKNGNKRSSSKERSTRSKRRRSRSWSYSRHRSHSRSKSPRKHRSPSRNTLREHARRKERSRSRNTSHHESSKERRKASSPRDSKERHRHSESKSSRSDRYKARSSSKEKRNDFDKIDKGKLLAIARKNAKKLIEAGIVAGDKLPAIKSGGKTVNELTEYCKKLAMKDAGGDDLSDINSDSNDSEDAGFHHPFQVRDRPNSIVMNIKNAIPLPVKSLHEKAIEQSKQLRLQFPVSSGSSHRLTESEWVPVEPVKEKKKPPPPALPAPHLKPPPMPPLAPPPALPQHLQTTLNMSAVPPPPCPSQPVFPVIQPSVSEPASLEIGSLVSKRLNAMRKLQEDPHDVKAKVEISRSVTEMQNWAERRKELKITNDNSSPKFLSPAELGSGTQAWAKRDQLISATPVKGGMGMTLLQKMGWHPGEGLGKNKEGSLEPLKLEVKTDKKGLVATDEAWKRAGVPQIGPPIPTVKTLDGKHPVSLLNEYCCRRRWNPPIFDLAFECGPDHKKNFLYKVIVNDVEYKPSVASVNKKQARAEAAAICLRALGLLSNGPPPTVAMLEPFSTGN